MNENSKTLREYDANFQNYIDGTPSTVTGNVKDWINKSLSLIKSGGTILEIGSAFGRDARYMEQKGFKITPSDGSIEFVKYMRKHGQKAKLINAITDDLGGPYDMVYANAVLLHFTIQQTEEVLDKIHSALKDGGIFSFRTKEGRGHEWSSYKIGAPRFFQYWESYDLKATIKKHGFKLVEVTNTSSDSDDFQWLHFIAKK